ncbi:MAG: hypothetical protein SPD47_06450 [Oscillospiraceae bacterium]|nr:hypothetical protein [Oscillospiraceae bacterium]
MALTIKTIEYKCSWCGATETRSTMAGRPSPGYCPRKPKSKDGTMKPHTWVKNRSW